MCMCVRAWACVCVCDEVLGEIPCLRCSGELQPYSFPTTIQQKTAGRETDRLPGMFSNETLSTALYYLYQEGWVRGGGEGGGGNKGIR